MIGFVEGEIIERAPTRTLISCCGVGYEVAIPLSTFDHLPDVGENFRILTRLIVREDAHLLFGFATVAERRTFDLLCSVSRVGPKLALAILSGLSVTEIRRAIGVEDAGMLSSISGVGKRTAERICVELKDKIAAVGPVADAGTDWRGHAGEGSVVNEAVAALMVLGYSRSEAQDAVGRAAKHSPECERTEDLIRHALGSRAG